MKRRRRKPVQQVGGMGDYKPSDAGPLNDAFHFQSMIIEIEDGDREERYPGELKKLSEHLKAANLLADERMR
jgi:hypothetical protein